MGNFNAVCTLFSLNKRPSVQCALAANEICNSISMYDNHIRNVNFFVSWIIRYFVMIGSVLMLTYPVYCILITTIIYIKVVAVYV
jgi:hypothetical protein